MYGTYVLKIHIYLSYVVITLLCMIKTYAIMGVCREAHYNE